jgi:hypothetical protein
LDFGVNAVADGNIDQTVFSAEWNGRLGAQLGERIKPSPSAAA